MPDLIRMILTSEVSQSGRDVEKQLLLSDDAIEPFLVTRYRRLLIVGSLVLETEISISNCYCFDSGI